MGCGASTIVPTPEGFEYFSLTFHWVDIIRLIHAKPRTSALVKKCLLNHWIGKKKISDQSVYYGAMDFEVQGRPFAKGTGQTETIASKVSICHMLEYLMADGWRIVVSSDMSRIMDQTAWWLRQYPVKSKRPAHVCTLSLSATDQLQLLRANEDLYDAMKGALKKEYSKPIQGELDEIDLGKGNFMVKLKGNPWASEGQEGMEARKFLLEMIRRFQALGYFPYNTANLKGTADSIFFHHHPDGSGWIKPSEYCMLSLNQHDRLRLLDCPPDFIPVIREVIGKYRGQGTIQREQEFHGSYEFKLKGNPWCAEAQDTVYSRLLIAKVLEGVRGLGWEVSLAVDTSCKMNDKAVLILKQANGGGAQQTHFCLCPTDIDRIRLIGAPTAIINVVRDNLKLYYPPGIAKENPDHYTAHEFKLSGQPFSGRHGTHELHIRSFFCFLLQAFYKLGIEPVASCDVSAKHIRTENGPDYPNDVHSWFFARVR